MSITLTMPRLSDTMEQGTIIRWNVKEGQEVLSGAIVADIETDKAVMEQEAFDDGTLAVIVAAEGAKAAVGATIAVLAVGEEIVRISIVGAVSDEACDVHLVVARIARDALVLLISSQPAHLCR